MSNPEFPSQLQLNEAYTQVLSERCEVEATSLASNLRKLYRPLWSEDSEPTAEGIVGLSNVRKLDLKYGFLFNAIGVLIDTAPISVTTEHKDIVDMVTIVPELIHPERFADYLGHDGIESLMSSPVHVQLARDALNNIYRNALDCDELLTIEDETSDAVPGFIERKEAYIYRFEAIQPVYFRAGFDRFMPAAFSYLQTELNNQSPKSL